MDEGVESDRLRLRIVLADDNVPFRRRLGELLNKDRDFKLVGVAADGEEAVRLARKLNPDVVIIDIMMPRLNGIEATQRITGESLTVKVIGLSGHGDEGFRRAMLDAGASIYLLKDNVRDELPRVLRSIVAKRR